MRRSEREEEGKRERERETKKSNPNIRTLEWGIGEFATHEPHDKDRWDPNPCAYLHLSHTREH
jgi:hypothetical protein